MDVRLLLGKKCYEACLEAIDRLPFADTDEDGSRPVVPLSRGPRRKLSTRLVVPAMRRMLCSTRCAPTDSST